LGCESKSVRRRKGKGRLAKRTEKLVAGKCRQKEKKSNFQRQRVWEMPSPRIAPERKSANEGQALGRERETIPGDERLQRQKMSYFHTDS